MYCVAEIRKTLLVSCIWGGKKPSSKCMYLIGQKGDIMTIVAMTTWLLKVVGVRVYLWLWVLPACPIVQITLK